MSSAMPLIVRKVELSTKHGRSKWEQMQLFSNFLSYAIVIQLLYHQGGMGSVAEWLVTTRCFG